MALAGKEAFYGPSFHYHPFCSFVLPCLISFCSLQTPIFACYFFWAVWEVVFFSPRIFPFCLFYSFLCILNDLHIFLLNLSLMTIFTPCCMCMDTYTCYGSVMYLENGCTQEILLQITLRELRSRTCSVVVTKLDMLALFNPLREANVICVSPSLVVPLLQVSSRSKGEATQVLSQLEGEVCMTGRVLRAVVSCLCFCSHWYFLIVTLFSFQLSFLIPWRSFVFLCSSGV